jgi:ribosomal-protein-alanine N-acetyltransferase
VTMTVQVRWMIRRDMPEVLQIESESFDLAWQEDDFIACLTKRNCIGMVADHIEHSRAYDVAGFMIYELHKAKLHVLNFAVAPWARRQDVGTQLIEKLLKKLSQQRRTHLTLDVRESNLPAQLFFQRMGFRAISVERGAYEDTDEAAYRMEYRIGADEATGVLAPRNRIQGR